MPFDFANYDERPDLRVPSVEALIWILRHPDTWPDNFRWDYRKCNDCALGLMYHFWGTLPLSASEVLGISFSDGQRIFTGLGRSMGDVTATDVADELEIYRGTVRPSMLRSSILQNLWNAFHRAVAAS